MPKVPLLSGSDSGINMFSLVANTDTKISTQCNCLAKVASAPFVDHWLDQRFWMDRPRCIRRPAREPAHCWSHIFHAPRLHTPTLASVSNLHHLQPLCILAQCFRQFTASLCDERRFRVVHYWFYYHFHHRPGMLVSKLRKW